MATECSAYMGVSVDGFIARSDGGIDWLERPEYAHPDNLGLEYSDFISRIDTIVMGRRTFEKVLSFPQWPYGEMPIVVLTTQELEIPERLMNRVRLERGAPGEVAARLEAEGKRHLYIDGGATVQRFLRAGLITELTLTYLPILLGEGISLFGSLGTEIPLMHLETTSSSSGLVQVRYRPKKISRSS